MKHERKVGKDEKAGLERLREYVDVQADTRKVMHKAAIKCTCIFF